MKKKITVIITLAILMIPVISLQAGIRIGVKAGVNVAKASFDTKTLDPSNYTGFQVGPIIELSALGLGFDAAVLYNQRGFKSTVTDGTVTNEIEQKVNSVDIPVNLKFKFSLVSILGAYVSAGPYVSFKLNGNDATSIIGHDFKADWKSNNFGAGLNFGFGVELIKHLQIGANYQLGLTDDYSNFNVLDSAGKELFGSSGSSKSKPSVWSVTVAYFF